MILYNAKYYNKKMRRIDNDPPNEKKYFTLNGKQFLSRMQVRFLQYYSNKGRVVGNTTTDNTVFSRNLFFLGDLSLKN